MLGPLDANSIELIPDYWKNKSRLKEKLNLRALTSKKCNTIEIEIPKFKKTNLRKNSGEIN